MAFTATALPPTKPPPSTTAPTPPPTPPLPRITLHTSPTAARRFNALVSRVFVSEPLTILFQLEADRPPDNIIREQLVLNGYSQRTTRKLADGGVIIEAGDWAAAAIWDPPGAAVMGPRLSDEERAARPVFARFTDSILAAKLKYMGPGQKYWHLSMMARDPLVQPRVKGAVRAVIEPYLRRAEEEGLPVWIEAGSARARDVYAFMGLETLEKLTNGEGTHRADGYPASDGEDAPGVPIWFMIYNHIRPRSTGSGLVNGVV